MSKDLKIIIIGFVVIGIVALFIHFFMTQEPVQRINIKSLSPKPKDWELKFSGAQFKETKDGKTLWDVKADSIQIDREGKEVSFYKVKCQFYNKNLPALYLLAPETIINYETKDILMEKGITAGSNEGYFFKCNNLRWVSSEEKLYAEGNVRFGKENMIFTSNTMQADIMMDKVIMEGNVSVKVKG